MKWLIIGTGNISSAFISSLKRVGETPYAILSRNINRASEFANENKVEKYFDNYNKALKDVDVVYVATPNAFHYEYAIKALNENKHIMVEKPMTNSYEKTVNLYKIAKKNNLKVMEAYAHITQPEFKKLVVKKGSKIKANLQRISSHIKNKSFENASTFRKDTWGGVIPDMGVYPLSLFVDKLGKILNYKITKKEYLNDVLISVKIDLTLENGNASTLVSKIHDGNTSIYIDNIKTDLMTHGSQNENKMDYEVLDFVNNKNLSHYKNVSLEVAKFIEKIKDQLFR